MEVWKGCLRLKDGAEIQDIRLNAPNTKSVLSPQATLQFLSHVEVSRIPLHLICGPRLDVWTTDSETENWFSSFLFNSTAGQEQGEWWHSARAESPLGILAAVKCEDESSQPRTTEILFYASRACTPDSPPTPPHSSQQDAPQPELQLYALPLSSDLIPSNIVETTPPSSPTLKHSQEGRFLSRPWESSTNILAQKRRQALESTFNAADEQRKRKTRHLGESVAAAAAANNATSPLLPTLKPRDPDPSKRPASESRTQVPILTRPSTRSPSVTSIRKEVGEHKRSSLVHVTPAPTNATDQKNKDMISKIVMAGMRVWGLTQSKRAKRKSIPSCASFPSQTSFTQNTTSFAQEEEKKEKQNDDEYKLIYHNVYKSTLFAFRTSISEVDLAGYTSNVRDVVDGFLVLFCKDPLVLGLEEEKDRVMSAGPVGAVVFDG